MVTKVNSNMPKVITIYDRFKTKLTKAGAEYLNKYYDDLFDDLPVRKYFPIYQENSELVLDLMTYMNIFGSTIIVGNDIMFQKNELIEEN